MDWKTFGIQILLQLGGFAVIAATILKKIGNTLVDNLSEKYKYHLEKKLEEYKNTLENKSYVEKAKFDSILNVYPEISKILAACFSSIKSITPKENQGITDPVNNCEIEESIKNLREFIQNYIFAFSKEILSEIQKLILTFENQLTAYNNLSSDVDDENYDFLSLNEVEELENHIYEMLWKSYSNLEISSANPDIK